MTGRTVFVLGAGPIALLFTVLLGRRRAGRVVVGGRSSRRLAAHSAEGAETLAAGEDLGGLLDRTGGRGADLVVEATGDPEVAGLAPSLAARGGTVLLFAGLPREARLSILAHRIHYDEVTIAGSFHYTAADARAALDLLSSGAIPAGRLVTAESPLEGHEAALDRVARGDEMKVAFLP